MSNNSLYNNSLYVIKEMMTNGGKSFKYQNGNEYFVAFNEEETQVKCDGNVDENELYHLITILQKALSARLSPSLISSCVERVSNVNEALALYLEEINNQYYFYIICENFNKEFSVKLRELEKDIRKDNSKLEFEFSVRETQGKVKIETLGVGSLIWKR